MAEERPALPEIREERGMYEEYLVLFGISHSDPERNAEQYELIEEEERGFLWRLLYYGSAALIGISLRLTLKACGLI